MQGYSRRSFLKAAGMAAGSSLPVNALARAPLEPRVTHAQPNPTGDNNTRRVISASDLVYTKPVVRSEEGIPIGNGRMGSLVWTTRNRLHFQINRADVYANNCESNSFNEAHNDYCGGCAFFDVELEGDPFPDSGFRQHLSVYDGMLEIAGEGLQVRIVPFMNLDVIAVTIEKHGAGIPIAGVLRMLRYETKFFGRESEALAERHAIKVRHRSQSALSTLLADKDRIALTQEFTEGTFCCKSAVAISFAGQHGEPEVRTETDVSLTAREANTVTILISSAATFEHEQNVAALAFEQLEHAHEEGSAALERASRQWWHDFWSGSIVELHSEDGEADFVQQSYHYFLYLMAATSRGKLPPKFNGMLWNTAGDLRMWGAQHWFTNLGCYYHAMPATGRFELMDPMYTMYSSMSEACSRAASQQWGSQGMYIPETVYFDGLEKLPDPIAAEMRELYLLHKPWEKRSEAFVDFAQTKHPYSSRWNWIASGHWSAGRYVTVERGFGPYGPTSHMFSSTAKVAWLYWQRYEFTQDASWLRERAYPMLRGSVEFYRNHPNLKKDGDGRYHMHWSNSGEPVFGARDSLEDIACMRAVTAVLLRASALLGIDEAMRPAWAEFLDHLAPFPTSDMPEALRPDGYAGKRVFVNGLKPCIKADRIPTGWLPDINSLPVWWFDFCCAESSNQELKDLAQATFDQLLSEGLHRDTKVGPLSMMAIAAATLGRADAVRIMIPSQMRSAPDERSIWYKKAGLLENRMTLREGAQALHAEHLGRASEALHRALLQSAPPSPGEDPILRLFPAWPPEWEARYTLRARGGFSVTASIRKGTISEVKLISHAGSVCKLRNPFPGREVQLHRNQHAAELLSGEILEFHTDHEEEIVISAAREDAGERE